MNDPRQRPASTLVRAGRPSWVWTNADKVLSLLCGLPGAGPAFRALFPPRFRQAVHARRVLSLPSRVYLETIVIPGLCGQAERILSVGVDRYTRHYPELFERRGADLHTIDVNPDVAGYGRPGRHRVLDVLDVSRYVSAGFFDAVLFNGVFGYGINEPEAMDRALHELHAVLRVQGALVIGWNRGLSPDPLDLPGLAPRFQSGSTVWSPARVTFPGETHIYDLLVKR